jgi:CubicO group peptidase (beta-lactamase class C family)
LKRYDLPALAAAVVRDGTVIAAGAVGTRRVGSSIPVTINDRFHLGSDTKAMTALLAAMLVEENKLRWDTTVGEVFPELAAHMDAGLRGVTLTQLLSHTSGVPSDNKTFDELIVKANAQDGNLDEMRYWLVREWSPQPLVSHPGSTFAYANMNYVIAGAMIERITGRTWEELITERVFTPLDLKTAGLGNQASLGRVDAPLGHATVDGKTKVFLSGPNGDNPPILGPAGTAHMSVLDFARWAGWNAGEGKRGPALVKPETMHKLHTPVITMPPKPDAPPGTPRGGGYGLGWGQFSVDWAPTPLGFHGGSNTKMIAQIWVDPAQDFAMVVMTNIGGTHAEEGLFAVAAELYPRFVAAAVPTPSQTKGEEPAKEEEGGIFGAPKRGRPPQAGDTQRGRGL